MINVIAVISRAFFAVLRVSPQGSFPRPLSAEEEGLALERMAAGDTGARDLLIERNLRLVAHVVKKYYAASSDQDDLISIGTIGLIKAIESYTDGRNARLSTYACRCIENEILMYFRSKKRLAQEVSLSEPIENDRDGSPLYLIDVLKYPDNMSEAITDSETKSALRRFVFTALDKREREIIIRRYGLGGEKPLTQRECACLMGISRSYVSRIEKKALDKLRQKVGS